MNPWPQPIAPLGSLPLSALAAALPLAVVLVLMGGLRKSGLLSSLCGLAATALLALAVWQMPAPLVFWSAAYGAIYAVWPILWIVFCALWLYNLTQVTGAFELFRRWMQQHASGDPGVQVILIVFCFGALLEGTAGFGAPVAVIACLLVGLGHRPHKAVLVALIANTAPVAFGALGIPTVALAGVTGLSLMKLSAMTGRQVPILALILPAYLVWVTASGKGLRRSWPAALVAGITFAGTQCLVSNLWGPYVADVLAASLSIAALVAFLKLRPKSEDSINTVAPIPATSEAGPPLTVSESFSAWLPWIMLSIVMILWSWLKLLTAAQVSIPIPSLHNGVLISLYQKPYTAVYVFQSLGPGTAILVATILTALCLRARPRVVLHAGIATLRQLTISGITVMAIVALAYLYNYSGMAFTLGAALASVGPAFPLVSGFLGWVACFLSGSDTASNLLFGNLQVAAAHQLNLSPVLLASTNSAGAVAGKMISPQNIAVGVTTVGLTGQEGKVLRSALGHSVLFATLVGLIALAQAYWFPWMIP